jgi:hypothetical protein
MEFSTGEIGFAALFSFAKLSHVQTLPHVGDGTMELWGSEAPGRLRHSSAVVAKVFSPSLAFDRRMCCTSSRPSARLHVRTGVRTFLLGLLGNHFAMLGSPACGQPCWLRMHFSDHRNQGGTVCVYLSAMHKILVDDSFTAQVPVNWKVRIFACDALGAGLWNPTKKKCGRIGCHISFSPSIRRRRLPSTPMMTAPA